MIASAHRIAFCVLAHGSRSDQSVSTALCSGLVWQSPQTHRGLLSDVRERVAPHV